jgi:hypothetical protein
MLILLAVRMHKVNDMSGKKAAWYNSKPVRGIFGQYTKHFGDRPAIF